jgi:hypothetical protein
MSDLAAQIQHAENEIASVTQQRLSVGAALAALENQLYAIQLKVLHTARRACQQYEYWTLSSCTQACPMPPSPTTKDIDTFAAMFSECVHQHPYVFQAEEWVQLTFNRSTHPEAFVDAEKGVFYLEVYMPDDVNGFGVHTQDYRFFVLPLGALVSAYLSSLCTSGCPASPATNSCDFFLLLVVDCRWHHRMR